MRPETAVLVERVAERRGAAEIAPGAAVYGLPGADAEGGVRRLGAGNLGDRDDHEARGSESRVERVLQEVETASGLLHVVEQESDLPSALAREAVEFPNGEGPDLAGDDCLHGGVEAVAADVPLEA